MRPVTKDVERCRIFLNFLEKTVLFVLNCRNLKILRDFCDFDSYISYGESVHARERAREGFARSQGKTGAAVLRQSFPGHFNPIRVHPIPVQVVSAVLQAVSVLLLINTA